MTDPEMALALGGPLCRRCVRMISRRLSDVPGVASLRVDAATGVVHVSGSADPAQLAGALPAATVRWCGRVRPAR